MDIKLFKRGIAELSSGLNKLKSLNEITFCVFDETNYKTYHELLKDIP